MSTPDTLRHIITRPGENVTDAAVRVYGRDAYVDVLNRAPPGVPPAATVGTTATGPFFRVYAQPRTPTRVIDGLSDSLAAYAQTLDGGESPLARMILSMADRLKLPGAPFAVDDAREYLSAYFDAGTPGGGYDTVARGCGELLASIAAGKTVAGAWLRGATSPTRPAVTMGRDSLACGTGRVLEQS